MSELDDIKREGADPFAALETDTPTESPSVNEPESKSEAVKPEEGDSTPDIHVPFHKDPRWIKREEELKSLREAEDAHAKEIEELKAFREETRTRTPSAIPDWFRELYGDNEVAWNKYSEHDKTQREEIKREVLAEQDSKRRQEADQATRWNKWVDDQIGKLAADGKTFDRNKLIKTMLDYRPTDEQGNFDFQKGYAIYEAMEAKEVDPAKSHARKAFADMTSTSNKGEKAAKDYLTPQDLRNKSWGAL